MKRIKCIPLLLLFQSLTFVNISRAAEVDVAPTGLGYFVTETTTGASNGLHLYKIDTDGVATRVVENLFPDSTLNTFSASDYTVNTKTGKIYFMEPYQGGQRRIRIYDIESETFDGYTTIDGIPDSGNPVFIDVPTNLDDLVQKTCSTSSTSCASSDPETVSLGGSGTSALATIDSEGLAVGGASIIKRTGTAIHIGENSLVTDEVDGVQKLYATDANLNAININVTEGSKLLVDGVEVDPSAIAGNASAISSNDTDISANSSAISSNDDDISSLQSLVKSSGSEVQIGSDSDGVTISSSAVKVGGENMIRKESDGSVHIGKNSLVLKESGGRQQMWATDADGNAIDIDIVNSSDLLINGKSIQGQIDSNAANIRTNTANISTNAKNISNLGTGIAAATSLTAALSALPAASADSPFSCGVGTGGYSDKFALGVGCAAKINQRLNANIAASHVFGGSVDYGEGSLDTLAARAGFVFKFGKIDDSAKVAARKAAELHDKVAKLEERNESLLALLQAQASRLERLEQLASGQPFLLGDRALSD